MADAQAKPAAARKRAKAGDNTGEAGDNTGAGAGDNTGELAGDGSGTALPPIEEGAEGREQVDEGSGTAPVIERMERMATEAVLNTASLVADARDFMLDQIKARPKPWNLTPFDEQRDVAAAAEHAAKELVRKIVEAVRAEGPEPIRALLESYSEKDGLKASLKIKTFNDEESLAAVIGLHKAVGKHVLITVASVEDFNGDQRGPELMEDQQGLTFEAGTDHPGDDSDLAAGGAEPVVRLNLDEGMFQKLQDGGDPEDSDAWDDVRAATPAEMAAERERIADFNE